MSDTPVVGRITFNPQPDIAGLGRIKIDGRLYGIPAWAVEHLAAITKERDEWKAKAEANERIKLFAGILLEYFIPDPCDVDGEFFERAAIKCGLFIRISNNNWALSDSGMAAVDAARSAEKEK